MLFCVVAAPSYILTNSVGGFPFLHILSVFVICRLLNDGRSDWCEVTPYCGLICISLMDRNVEHLSCAY